MEMILSFSPPPGQMPEDLDLPSRFFLEECRSCRTLGLNPYPGPETLRRYFASPARYALGKSPEGRPVDPLERAEARLEEYRSYAKAMMTFLPEEGMILDVGAGTGLLLSLLPERYERLALEPNSLAAEAARLRGLETRELWAEDLRRPRIPLSALAMTQSLDHLARPDLFLSKVLPWLAPGGLVLLGGLINPHSLAARIYGPGHRLYHPFHQVYPPPKAVTDLLAAYGFEIIRAWRPYFKTPYGSLRTLIKDSFSMAKTLLWRSPDSLSPPWPGNTVTYLARKTLLFRPLALPKAAHIEAAA
jgi:SAM-dependent methyltransferase